MTNPDDIMVFIIPMLVGVILWFIAPVLIVIVMAYVAFRVKEMLDRKDDKE